MEDAPAGMCKARHGDAADVIESLGTTACRCLVAGFLAQRTKSLALQVEQSRNILFCCNFYFHYIIFLFDVAKLQIVADTAKF